MNKMNQGDTKYKNKPTLVKSESIIGFEKQKTNTAQSDENDKKKFIIYDLIFLQISNLIKDIRIVFPKDIVFKVLQDNLPCFQENKVEGINYMKTNISKEIKLLIQNKDASLFDPENKSLKNIKFKRSEFVFSKIRKIWSKLDNANRVVIWKYLNFILKLLEKV